MSTNVPKVSVLIPAYNRGEYVAEAIQSVLDQTYTDFEVVVVDDGSIDNTAEVVKQFSDRRVHLVCQENRGVSGAFNTAFRHSLGSYIAMLGSDDVWLPNLLERQVPILDTNPGIGLVYARAQYMDARGNLLLRFDGVPLKFPGQPLKSLAYGDHVSGITALMRRELIEKAGLWNETPGANEDWDMWLRLAFLCQFQFQDVILAHARSHSGNITGTNSPQFRALQSQRVKTLDRVFARPNLPPDLVEIRPIAYRNAHIDVGQRWLKAREWSAALDSFKEAVHVSRQPVRTLTRIAYHILFFRLLSGFPLISHLVIRLAKWRYQNNEKVE